MKFLIQRISVSPDGPKPCKMARRIYFYYKNIRRPDWQIEINSVEDLVAIISEVGGMDFGINISKSDSRGKKRGFEYCITLLDNYE